MELSSILVNFIFILILQNIQGEDVNEELYSQDPDSSGVRQCRKCSLEFSKLDKAEQDIWTKYKDMHYTEFRQRFRMISDVSREVIVDPEHRFLKDLYPEELNLMKWYLLELDLSEEERQGRVQKLSEIVGSIRAWQEYEKELTSPDLSEPKVQIQPEMTVPIQNATLTKQERIEL